MLLYWSECSLDEVGAAMKAVVQPLTLSLLLSGFCLPAYATNGYFMHSFGVKAQGNAGTATAHFQDALSIASNPAGLSWVNNQFNLVPHYSHPIVQLKLREMPRVQMDNMMAMLVDILLYQSLPIAMRLMIRSRLGLHFTAMVG